MQIEYEGFRKRTEYTIVAFYQEYSRYHYLYFTIGKQWSKDLMDSNGKTTNQHTSIAREGSKSNDRSYAIRHTGDRSSRVS
jgi:hypothetical protein